MATPCVWGIMSTANIARKNIAAMQQTTNTQPKVIASRSVDKASAFATECNVPEAVGSYAELLSREDIDAIYLPIPSALHFEWVKKIAEAGKHVLCEKPCAVTEEQLREMIAVCRAKGVMFMDGVMFMHHNRLTRMRELIDSGVLGPCGVRHVSTEFTFSGGEDFFSRNVRARPDADPLGCLGDLGWYNLRFTLWAFNYEMPHTVQGTLHDETADGVPVSFTGQVARVYGSDGVIAIDDGTVINGPDPEQHSVFKLSTSKSKTPEEITVEPCDQAVCMWERASTVALNNPTEEFWPRVALQTQVCLEALLKSARNGSAMTPVPTVSL